MKRILCETPDEGVVYPISFSFKDIEQIRRENAAEAIKEIKTEKWVAVGDFNADAKLHGESIVPLN